MYVLEIVINWCYKLNFINISYKNVNIMFSILSQKIDVNQLPFAGHKLFYIRDIYYTVDDSDWKSKIESLGLKSAIFLSVNSVGNKSVTLPSNMNYSKGRFYGFFIWHKPRLYST